MTAFGQAKSLLSVSARASLSYLILCPERQQRSAILYFADVFLQCGQCHDSSEISPAIAVVIVITTTPISLVYDCRHCQQRTLRLNENDLHLKAHKKESA